MIPSVKYFSCLFIFIYNVIHKLYLEYICPQCKQFNPSRKSKQAVIDQVVGAKPGEEGIKKDLSVVEEEDTDQVIEKLKAQIESDKQGSIGARVRQRHSVDEDDEEEED